MASMVKDTPRKVFVTGEPDVAEVQTTLMKALKRARELADASPGAIFYLSEDTEGPYLATVRRTPEGRVVDWSPLE